MTGLIYIGKGAFVPGMYPARDLTAEEVAEFGKANLLATGLYEEKKISFGSQKQTKQINKEEEKES